MPKQSLSKSLMLRALQRLSDLAVEENVDLELCLYGGAVMVLAYDARASTKDVDAIFRPKEAVTKLAIRVAKDLNIHEDWLNDDVKMYASYKPNTHPLTLEGIDLPNLTLSKPTASYLLAMKAVACRDPFPGFQGDHEDLAFLISKMEIKSVDQVQEHIDKYFLDTPLSSASSQKIQAIIDTIYAK